MQSLPGSIEFHHMKEKNGEDSVISWYRTVLIVLDDLSSNKVSWMLSLKHLT